jgi:hypothetical protein
MGAIVHIARARNCQTWKVLPACFIIGILFADLALSTDIRVKLNTVSPTYGGTSVGFLKGGRIGNWVSGTGNTVVLGANIYPFSQSPTIGTVVDSSGNVLLRLSN